MKKLKLNKETISFLNRNQMQNVKGGGTGGTGAVTIGNPSDSDTYTSDAACPPSDNCPTKGEFSCIDYGCSRLATCGCETDNCITIDPTTGSIANPGPSGGPGC